MRQSRPAQHPVDSDRRRVAGVSKRWIAAVGALLGAAAIGAVILVTARAGDEIARADPGPVHVHGLGVNPADDALFIATHSGLYRLGSAARSAVRVGDRRQDTMGFTVVGQDRFLGSGHPDLEEMREQELPAELGLIESVDAGRNWKSISLAGEADFHVLRANGSRIYGYDATRGRLLRSSDRGSTWETLPAPGPVVDLAPHPLVADVLVVTSVGGPVEGMFLSRNAGNSWERTGDAVGLLSWQIVDALLLLAGNGEVLTSRDEGRSFEQVGSLGSPPAAVTAGRHGAMFVALHDGSIVQSTDGGRAWSVRATP